MSSFDPVAVRADFPILSREIGGKPLVYLDNGATTQKPRRVIEALSRFFSNENANIHRGVHYLSREATDAYDGARDLLKERLRVPASHELIFVRGTTEAINLVTHGLASELREGDEIVLTMMEHHANFVPWQVLAQQTGAVLRFAGLRDNGELDLEEWQSLFTPRTRVAAFTQVSNVLGTINPLSEISRRAHEAGALVLADGAQAAPKLPLSMTDLGVDFYALTGHKLYGPTGIGALWARHDLLDEMPPFIGGGSMIKKVTTEGSTFAEPPARFEAGTPPISQAIGLAASLRWLEGLGMDAVRVHETEIADYTLQRLNEVPGLRVFGPAPSSERVGPVSFEIEGIHPHDVAEILDRHAVAVRSGHHCAQPLMDYLGVPATTRASFAVHTDRSEIDRLIEGLLDARRVFKL